MSDRHWTTDAPEAGREYWMTAKPRDGMRHWKKPARKTWLTADIDWWPSAVEKGVMRSVLPIPPPIPPALPASDGEIR